MDFGKPEVNTENDDRVWVNLRAIMAETRSDAPPFTGEATFEFSRVVFNDEAGSDGSSQVITMMNDAEACSVWVTQHPDAQFPVEADQTDGARLGRALQRAFGGASNEEIQDNANNYGGGSLSVTQVQYGDDPSRWAWLWQVNTV